MDNSVTKIVGLAAVTALIAAFVIRAAGAAEPEREAAGVLSIRDSASRAKDSAQVRWLDDGNVMSILALVNAKEIAVADAELQSWRSDTVRALAAGVAREHAELQHSVDSVAQAARIAPIAPAIQQSIAN